MLGVGCYTMMGMLQQCLKLLFRDLMRVYINLVYRGYQVACLLTGSMRSTLRLGQGEGADEARWVGPFAICPFWFIPKFSHFGESPDPVLWAQVCIKQLQYKISWGEGDSLCLIS